MHSIRSIPALIVVLSLLLLSMTACNDKPTDTTSDAIKPVTAAKPADAAAPAELLTGSLNIAGGTAHIPIMQEAQKVFAAKHPDLKIAIAGGGSGVGIKQVGEGLVDIGNSGRTPTPEEIEQHGLVLHKWAVDGVAVVVNPENAVGELTKEQLVKVFSGEISNWNELGGSDNSINVYTRDEESGTRKVYVKIALDGGGIVDSANVVVSNGAMKSAVSQDPYAIGYVSVGHIDDSVKAVTLDGAAPTLDNVKDGTYGVARGLYSLTKGEATEAAKAFIDFLYTPDGQQIITEQGFIPTDK